MENDGFTQIEELGEFGLIEYLTQNIKVSNKSTIKSVGDDCAVIDYEDEVCVVSSDLLIQGVHFDLTYVPLKHLGYKAVVAGISDVYAMNATAQQVIISIAVSNKFSVEMLETLYNGIITACNNYSVDFVGGDTSSSESGLIINVTALGSAKREDLVYRNGAKNNDIIIRSPRISKLHASFMQIDDGRYVIMDRGSINGTEVNHSRLIQEEERKLSSGDLIGFWRYQFQFLSPTDLMDLLKQQR